MASFIHKGLALVFTRVQLFSGDKYGQAWPV